MTATCQLDGNCSTLNLIFFIIINRDCYFCSADILEDDKSLVIKNVVSADEGIYICEAHNSVGQISAKAQLVVNCN